MKFCSNCGNPLPEGAERCPVCGIAVNQFSEQPVKPVAQPPQPNQQPPPPPPPASQQSPPPPPPQQPPQYQQAPPPQPPHPLPPIEYRQAPPPPPHQQTGQPPQTPQYISKDNQGQYQPPQHQYQPPNFARLNIDTTGYLVWSILTLILCCLPCGIIALVYSVTAKNAPTEEEARKKLKISMIVNIIGDVSVFILVILLILFLSINSEINF